MRPDGEELKVVRVSETELGQAGSVPARWLSVVVLAIVVVPPVPCAAEPTPAYRFLPAPKVLYLAGSPNSEQFAELLRHSVPASVAFAPREYGDLEFHHLTDKPLLELPQQTKEVARKGREYVDGLLERLDRFDLVIAQFPPGKEPQIERRLAAWVRRGGRLIYINPSWEITFDGTPLGEVMPVKTGRHKAWTSDCPGATDHPLVRGLPLEVLGTHWYGPVYEPADDRCQALSESNRAEQGWARNAQFWYRRLPAGGQVVHLFAAGDSKWQWHNGTNYAAYAVDRPDDPGAVGRPLGHAPPVPMVGLDQRRRAASDDPLRLIRLKRTEFHGFRGFSLRNS